MKNTLQFLFAAIVVALLTLSAPAHAQWSPSLPMEVNGSHIENHSESGQGGYGGSVTRSPFMAYAASFGQGSYGSISNFSAYYANKWTITYTWAGSEPVVSAVVKAHNSVSATSDYQPYAYSYGGGSAGQGGPGDLGTAAQYNWPATPKESVTSNTLDGQHSVVSVGVAGNAHGQTLGYGYYYGSFNNSGSAKVTLDAPQ